VNEAWRTRGSAESRAILISVGLRFTRTLLNSGTHGVSLTSLKHSRWRRRVRDEFTSDERGAGQSADDRPNPLDGRMMHSPFSVRQGLRLDTMSQAEARRHLEACGESEEDIQIALLSSGWK